MIKQRLADLMALVIVIAVIVMILGIDIFPDKDNNVLPIEENVYNKYPIARIEFTLEQLIKQMSWLDSLEANKITA